MENITYIFSTGRIEKLAKKTYEAKEFFYCYFNFIESGHKVDIIEFNVNKKNNIIYYIDRIFNKYISLPFYMSKLLSIENFNKIKNSDKIILINESTGFSCLPFLVYFKLFGNVEIHLIAMGLYSKKIKLKIFTKIHTLFIKLLINSVDKIFFLGQGEYEQAKFVHQEKISKFYYLPFSIDESFWVKNNIPKKNQIIFVGNDGNKDFTLVREIANKLEEFQFLIISNSNEFDSLDNKPNVKIIKSDWNNQVISDTELKKYYEESILSIIPVKDSFQPSGQSVALQSMSMGVPVIISQTKGFWDYKLFKNLENIVFVKNNNLDDWIETIRKYSTKKDLLDEIANNAEKLVHKKFKLISMYDLLTKK